MLLSTCSLYVQCNRVSGLLLKVVHKIVFLFNLFILIFPYSYLFLFSKTCLLCFLVHPNASRAELMMMTVSEIVSQLITAHEKGQDVNLNK